MSESFFAYQPSSSSKETAEYVPNEKEKWTKCLDEGYKYIINADGIIDKSKKMACAESFVDRLLRFEWEKLINTKECLAFLALINQIVAFIMCLLWGDEKMMLVLGISL